MSPGQLQKRVGSPSLSANYRWMRAGRVAPDAIVEANEEHVRRVADGLEVAFEELVDEPVLVDAASERTFRLAAALGPVVYPALLTTLGSPDARSGRLADGFGGDGAAHQGRRGRRGPVGGPIGSP